MKIIPIDIIKGMSGKICKHSDTSISLNSTSGLMYTSKLCNPYTGPASERQIAHQQAFKDIAQKASAWLKENRPSEALPTGTELYRRALSLKKELCLSNIRQVVCKYMDKQTGIVNLPESSKATNTIPSGGNGNTKPSDDDDNDF